MKLAASVFWLLVLMVQRPSRCDKAEPDLIPAITIIVNKKRY